MTHKKLVLGIFLFAFVQSAYSQYRDLGGWYSAELGYNIGKRWKIGLQEELRLNSNSTHLKKHFTQLNIKFEHKPYLQYSLGGRYVFNKRSDGYWERAFRINFDVFLKKNFYNYTIQSRTRVQYILDYLNMRDRANSDEALFREEITVEYHLDKWRLTPYFSAEIFWEDYRNIQRRGLSLETNAYRLIIGAKWKVAKRQTIGVFYGFESEVNQVINQKDFLIGIEYKYRLKFKTKKKKDEQSE